MPRTKAKPEPAAAILTETAPVPPTTPAPAVLRKVSLAGFAVQTPTSKSTKSYPLLPDPEGQVAELVTAILTHSAQAEALEGALELEKSELIAIAKPFYFAHHAGQHDLASSSPPGSRVLRGRGHETRRRGLSGAVAQPAGGMPRHDEAPIHHLSWDEKMVIKTVRQR